MKKILYPTDFSEHSQVALPLAVDLTEHYGAELHCLHAVDTEHEFFMRGGYVAPVRTEPVDSQRLCDAARRQMGEFIDQHCTESAGSIRQIVVPGKPFERIVRHAREENIDLIVIGTHGHSALASMLLGSVAEKVIRKAPCAVLSVRHREHKFTMP
jgi:nucleotide-binding universal stress UspA family protein